MISLEVRKAHSSDQQGHIGVSARFHCYAQLSFGLARIAGSVGCYTVLHHSRLPAGEKCQCNGSVFP
jgi:hypothetical protein